MKNPKWVYGAGAAAIAVLVIWFAVDTRSALRRAPRLPLHGGTAPPGMAGKPAPPVGMPPAAPMGATQEAERLKRALEVDPGNPSILTALGNLHYDASLWAEAIRYYEQALERVPNDPNVLTDTGVCYQQMRQYERAIEYFQRAQKADPSHWQSSYNEVVVNAFGLGRLDAAEAALARLAKANPSLPSLGKLREDLARLRAEKRGAAP